VSALHTFINKDAINLIGIMLSINCASIASLHIKLVDQEEKIDEGEVFAKTKKEIKHNAIFSIVTFFIAIISMFIDNILFEKKIIFNFYISDGIIMSVFLLQIYAIYETTVKFILSIKPLLSK
jgi:hypothetical protein